MSMSKACNARAYLINLPFKRFEFKRATKALWSVTTVNRCPIGEERNGRLLSLLPSIPALMHCNYIEQLSVDVRSRP